MALDIKSFVMGKYTNSGVPVYFGVTETAAGTSPKVVTTTKGNFKPTVGARIGVLFKKGNTSSTSITVDGGDQIRMVGAHKSDGSINSDVPVTYKPNGQVIWMTYDGEYFIVDSTQRATSDTVGLVTISDSVTSTGTQTAASSKAVKTVNDKIASLTDEISRISASLEALQGDA